VKADSGIKDINGLKGKKFAFVDTALGLGLRLPDARVKNKTGQDPKTFFSSTIFAGGHPQAALAVYQGTVDGAGHVHRRPRQPRGDDPRHKDETTVIDTAGPIPNDGVALAKNFPGRHRQAGEGRAHRFSKADDGKKVFSALFSWDGIQEITPSFYDDMKTAAALGGRRRGRAWRNATPRPAPTTAAPSKDAVGLTARMELKAAGRTGGLLLFHRLGAVGAVLQIKDLVKVYPSGTRAIDGVSLDIQHGEFVVLIGLSGSGKSSLLRCNQQTCRANERPHRLRRRGRDGSERPAAFAASGGGIGMIFQQFNLVRRTSVLSNTLAGRLGYRTTWRTIVGRPSPRTSSRHSRTSPCGDRRQGLCAARMRFPEGSSSASGSRGRSCSTPS